MPAPSPLPQPSLKKILAYMAQYNFKPRKKLGQNFLLDRNIKDIIVKSLNLEKEETLFEIGTGFGGLTLSLIPHVRHIFSIENDIRLKPILEEILAPYRDSVTVIYEDILTFDLVGFLRQKEQRGYHIEKLVGNLPYSISLPLLKKLMELKDGLKIAVVMVQKEVAERMLANPGGKDYGLLSVITKYYTETEKIHRVKPNVFFPKPEVESMLLRMQFLPTPRIKVTDETLFFDIVKAIFRHRRKSLFNALKLYYGDSLSKELLEVTLIQTGINPNQRGESLSLEELARLTAVLKEC
ncbi:MAG: ribosomal RNA small subunit methyltransferase A [Candidatus Atribacteria bacterium]|nr:ribosomal RNA small subunit methyltransferase A [Candidatus Atribacteria bacterium]